MTIVVISMEKLDKIKKILLNILTFFCIILLISSIVVFSIKKASEKYLQEEKLKEVINNVNIVELISDGNDDSEILTEVKNQIVELGVPVESIEGFIKTESVNKYASEIVADTIDSVLYNNDIKLLDNDSISSFFEENMDEISREMKEQNIPGSDKITEEKQQEILNKINDKAPVITDKINNVITKANDKLNTNSGYINKFREFIDIFKLLYGNVMDIVLIFTIIIFIVGIIITRKSIYNSLKWISTSFIVSGISLYLIGLIIPKILEYINNTKDAAIKLLNVIGTDMTISLNRSGMACFLLAIILIIINIVIYYKKEKSVNKKIENL